MNVLFGNKKEDKNAVITSKIDVSEKNNEHINESNQNSSENYAENKQRKVIKVCKIGADHIFGNKNNHDFTFNLLNMKVVLDGCGSGNHSEIGTRLFSQLFARKVKEFYDKGSEVNETNFIDIVDNVFYKMLALCDDANFILNNYCFTILVCFEFEDEFVVYSCGDGYIIKEDENGITFDVLDDGEYPCYYVYNFITDKTILKEYREGVSFNVSRFPKEHFTNVGVASDGLRYRDNLVEVEKIKLMRFLREGKGPQIEMLINRNNQQFHDDISICF